MNVVALILFFEVRTSFMYVFKVEINIDQLFMIDRLKVDKNEFKLCPDYVTLFGINLNNLKKNLCFTGHTKNIKD